jgi:hypothetical protein
MPRCNTEAMNLHLAEIATQIAPGAHAALLVDQAGWHLSGRLVMPPNITLIPLPAKCPELAQFIAPDRTGVGRVEQGSHVERDQYDPCDES